MSVNRQLCKCWSHEIDNGTGKSATFESYVRRTDSNLLLDAKIILTSYEFNVHYLVDWDEWHLRQFNSPKTAADFCRSLETSEIYNIFHQVSASVNGKSEAVARQINLRICEQMADDEAVLQQNNIQTVYKLAMKIWSMTKSIVQDRGIKTGMRM